MAKRRSSVRVSRSPRIEQLLAQAHANLAELRRVRGLVAAAGVPSAALPGDSELQAFALMGNHHRAEVECRAADSLALLRNRGLLRAADVREVATPVLRLCATIAPLLQNVLSVAQRVEQGIRRCREPVSSAADGPRIRCARHVLAQWGQALLVNAEVIGARWLLVRPDAAFQQRETLMHIDSHALVRFEISCEEGVVLIAAMDDLGNVGIHELMVGIEREDAA